MKTIQVTVDEELLAELDAADEVRQIGRSAVLRRAARDYLRRRREAELARQYRRAYGDEAGLGDDFEAWESEGEWPKK